MAQWIQKAVPKSRKGIFTAKAKKAGMGVQEYASKVLASRSADTKLKREAALAKRFKAMASNRKTTAKKTQVKKAASNLKAVAKGAK